METTDDKGRRGTIMTRTGNASARTELTLFDPRVFPVFIRDDEIVEVRAIHGRNVMAGYFNEHEAFCRAVRGSERAGGNIYFTLQVIDPRLLGRSFNRMKQGIATTSDNNVLAYRWLPVDIDPVRPSGVSSSDSELKEAYVMREQVILWMSQNMGFKSPIKAMSGNGRHLLYKLPDIEANEKNKYLIKNILEALHEEFSTSRVCIDTTVHNPARIWKLYGTKARKGDEIPAIGRLEARPHRTSFIESMGDINDN